MTDPERQIWIATFAVVVDDGSRDMHRKLADHLKGKDTAVARLPIEMARGEITKAIEARKAGR